MISRMKGIRNWHVTNSRVHMCMCTHAVTYTFCIQIYLQSTGDSHVTNSFVYWHVMNSRVHMCMCTNSVAYTLYIQIYFESTGDWRVTNSFVYTCTLHTRSVVYSGWQHTATHCNTLQYTATHCNTLQHTATHGNTLQHTATHCNTLPHTATLCNTLQHTATHCNTLQHTATHRNTLPHTCTLHTRSSLYSKRSDSPSDDEQDEGHRRLTFSHSRFSLPCIRRLFQQAPWILQPLLQKALFLQGSFAKEP